MLLQAAEKTIKTPPASYNVKPCRLYPEEIYDDYVEDILSVDARQNFERHFDTCLYCMLQVKEALLRDDRVDKSYILSDIGQKRSLNETLQRLDDLFKAEKAKKRAFLLAAADKRIGKTGIAYGIAVDRDSGTGAIMECAAWVSEKEADDGILELRGIEVEAVKKDDLQISITSPLNLLEDQLEDLIEQNPLLRPFRLWKRDITVDISHDEGNGYISEARSLSLAIIISILNAISGKENDRSQVFSAGIRQDGKLNGVGSIVQKLKISEEQGVTEFFLAKENQTDCNDALSISPDLNLRFFSALEDAFDYFGFFETLEVPPSEEKGRVESCVEKDKKYYRIPSSVEGWRFIVNLAREKGLQDNLAIELCELAEDLCQMRYERKALSTAFIVGVPEKSVNILPVSPLKLSRDGDIFSMREVLCKLSSIVDGLTMGFLIGTEGRLHSIRKLNIGLSGDFPVSRLFKGFNRRYAIISKMTDSMIFFISSADNQVKVFNKGVMAGRYKNGDWEPVDYDRFEQVLINSAEEKGILPEMIEKIGRTSIMMADLNEGGIFVFFKDIKEMQERYSDTLKYLSVRVDVESIRDLAEEELINFAKEDGALLMDNKGNFHTFMAFLRPIHRDSIEHDLGIGTRHFSAQILSKDIDCLSIVISQDGNITVYSDGDKLYQI